MDVKKKRRRHLNTVKTLAKTKKQVKYSKEASEESFDIEEECLNSVFEAVKNISMKPSIFMHTVKTKDLELAAVDIKEFSTIAFVKYNSSEIHVLSSKEDFISDINEKNRKRPEKSHTKDLEISSKLKEIKVLQHHTDVTAISYTNRNLLMSCCLDGTVKVWDRNYQPVYLFFDDTKFLSDIHASSRLDNFATSSLTGKKSKKGDELYGASLFSFSRNYPIMSFLGHTAATQCVRLHANGMYVATASEDNTLKMWSTQTSLPVRTFQEESKKCSHWRKLAFSPDGKYLVSTYFGAVKIWDIASSQLVKTLGSTNPNLTTHSVCYSKSGEELAAGGIDGELKIWNMKDFSLKSSVDNFDVELLGCYVVNHPILKIRCFENIFSCVSIVKTHSKKAKTDK